jgi:hypothetical protein
MILAPAPWVGRQIAWIGMIDTANANVKKGRAALYLAARRTQYELRTIAADYPSIYLPFVRRMHAAGPGKILGPDTKLVIDGYTRSASTFAVIAFQLAQPNPVRVARHLHAPAHLMAAARASVPALVCVRPPKPTVLSEVIREPHVNIAQALRSFIRFYERSYPFRHHFVIATFEQVTRDFGSAIAAVNAKFGTDFRLFDHTEENVERCFDLIELRSRGGRLRKILGDFQSGLVSASRLFEVLERKRDDEELQVNERWVARPSEQRGSLKAALAEHYESPALSKHRSRAEAAYTNFISDYTQSPNDRRVRE